MFNQGGLEQIRRQFETTFLTDSVQVAKNRDDQDEFGDRVFEEQLRTVRAIVEPQQVDSGTKARILQHANLDYVQEVYYISTKHDEDIRENDLIYWRGIRFRCILVTAPDTNAVLRECVCVKVSDIGR